MWWHHGLVNYFLLGHVPTYICMTWKYVLSRYAVILCADTANMRNTAYLHLRKKTQFKIT